MVIDRLDRAGATGARMAAGEETVPFGRMGAAVVVVRSVAMVGLAALAILVLLPAAIAAQAASAF